MRRYSFEKSQIVISNLKTKTVNDLDNLFNQGVAPSVKDMDGKTIGGFVNWNLANPFYVKFFVKALFASFIGRWTGKEFKSPLDFNQKGEGVNLFKNIIFPRRFKFKTYQAKSYVDGRLCLVLDYGAFFSLMSCLIDNVRKIDEGIFLGRMYYKFPWKKDLWFLGYFALCA